jgi:hypothetical protein
MQGCAGPDAASRPAGHPRERRAKMPDQLTANFRSLIAAKSLTSPPTRLVA